MDKISMQDIAAEVKDLPTLPAVVMEILNNIDRDDVDTHDLAVKVSRDSALTAKTLRYANSPYYATMVKVTTIQQAIALLGLATVRQIIVSAALSGCFPDNNCKGFSHKEFWEHCNTVAIIARILARRLGISQDVAATAGLLHDIGTLVLICYHGGQYEEVLRWQSEQQSTQLLAERQILGVDHAAVGEALAREWNFSEPMVHVISGHHEPEKPGLGMLASVIHVANGMAHVLHLNDHPDPDSPEISALSWQSLGLDQPGLDQILLEAGTEFRRLQQQVAL